MTNEIEQKLEAIATELQQAKRVLFITGAGISADSGLPTYRGVGGLYNTKDVRIERIVSTGHSSPPGFWYDQNESEWVVLLHGEAILEFEDEKRHMVPGDYVLIPPHCKHRVYSTSMKEPTVWLAVFFDKEKKT